LTEKKLKLYFPSLIPRRRHAQKWQCQLGYGEAPLAVSEGSLKLVHCRLKARTIGAVGKKLLFFSDLHYSGRETALVEELCRTVKKISPDLLLCGGDLTTDAVSLPHLPSVLKELSRCAPLCAVVPGNWERGKTWLSQSFWQDFFAECSWHYLCNRGLDAESWGWVYGSDEISRGYPALSEVPSADRENIFLVHRPDTVIAVDREDPLDEFTLALCGHTHGGQIRLPFLGALMVPSFYGRRMGCGLYKKTNSDTCMIISTGVNHASFPWRINCRREVILIEFF
jgi:predicted MPP superfamily phosphohydrolase